VRTPSRLLLAVVLVLGACASETPSASPAGSAPAPSTAPSATPGATASGGPIVAPSEAPSAAPAVDVSAAFIAALGQPAAFAATVEGTLTTKAGATPITGEYQQSGRDYHLKLMVDPARAKRPIEYTMVLGQRTTPGRGLALRSDAPGGAASLAAVIAGLSTLSDEGDGSDVFPGAHRLVPGTSVTTPLDFLGGFTPEAAAAKPTVHLFAGPDGTPQGLLATAAWTGRTTGKSNVELRFTITSTRASVTAPADIYRLYASRRYRMSLAFPSGWDVEPGKDSHTFDKVIGDADQYLYVFRARAQGVSLNEWTSTYIRGTKKDFPKLKAGKNVVTKLAGTRARLVRFSGTIDGDKVNEQMIVAVRNGYYYVIVMDVYFADDAAVTTNLTPIRRAFRYP
jgi:hypothetical protein